MAQDPVSAVASWITPATSGESLTASPPEDPVIALIAEEKRLEALWVAATTRGDEIFSTLPEDIQKGQVHVSFSDSELGQCISGLKNWFTSEENLQSFLNIWRRVPRHRLRGADKVRDPTRPAPHRSSARSKPIGGSG
jgi:hypothetical protein